MKMKKNKKRERINEASLISNEILAELNEKVAIYEAACQRLDDAFKRRELGAFEYDELRSGYDQAYQGTISRRNRILAGQDDISSELAKVVLTKAVLK